MEDIQRERDEILNATQEDIRGLRDMITSVLEEENLCVIGNEETLRSGKEMFAQLKNLY